jgi:secondary thiamine-phosphate synthase enzyme
MTAMNHLDLQTNRAREIMDITREVGVAVTSSGVREGLACLSVAHCTCALYVNENEDGLVADTLQLISRLADLPAVASAKGEASAEAGASGWQHDSLDDNAAAHLAATLLGSSVTLPVIAGRLELGTWQRVMLVELDGPRRRRVTVTVVGA